MVPQSARRNVTWAVAALASLAVAAAVTVGFPAEASACGGFACNNSQPINQADENIVFTSNGDGTVTAVIQIRYQGPSEKFAWLLPVPGTPSVDVSSSTIFSRLTSATNPNYQINTTVEGDCKRPPPRAGTTGGGTGGGFDAALDNADAGGGGVTVVDKGSVGPYNYTTISVDQQSSNPAQKAIDWLETNEYDVPDAGPDLIGEYLSDGMNLLAFKLTKDAMSGDVRPVKITYKHPLPMIPLKLTAVAAQEDMGVRVWVGGKNRAVPTRFKHVTLNPAAINWFNPQSTYNAVVTDAANEVGGTAFATEFAGDASAVEDRIFRPFEQDDWDEINRPMDWQGQEADLLFRTIRRYGQWDGILRVIRNEVPLPDDVTAQDFARRPFSVYDGNEADIPDFDPASYLEALGKNVIDPVKEAEAMLQKRSYLTRMFTTISPDEMVKDPTFDFTDKLPDVDQQRTAEQTIYCSEAVTRRQAPWKMVLPDGTTVWGEARNWPFTISDINTAKTAESFEMGPTDGEVVDSNEETIGETIDKHNESADKTPPEPEDGTTSGDGSGTTGSIDTGSSDGNDAGSEGVNFERSDKGGGCGCNAAGGSAPFVPMALFGLFFAVRHRRRN